MSASSSGPSVRARADEAAAVIRSALGEPPAVAVVLGSGLGSLIDQFDDPRSIPYARIPHFAAPTVSGHAGNVVVAAVEGARGIFLQGRFHYYEGHDLETVTFPIRALQSLGVRSLILTAATGGIRPDLRPGNIAILSDHLNLIGANPLRGPHDPRLGDRFPDMTEVYSRRLRAVARAEARRLAVDLIPVVYACLPGPSYETPAEIRMLRALGADVVGMSTAPEALVARQAGMEVVALTLITNPAAGVKETPLRHEDVLEAGRKATPILGKLIRRMVIRLAGAAPSGDTGLTGEFAALG